MISKRKLRKAHFGSRMSKRYGVSQITKHDRAEMKRQILDKEAKFVNYGSNGNNVYEVIHKDKKILVVFDENKEQLVTALPGLNDGNILN